MRRRSSVAEQLFCKQQVVSPILTVGSMTSRGFSLPIILAVVGVVLVGAGVVAFIYVTNSTNPALESNAYTPVQQTLDVPKPDAAEPSFKTPAASSPAATKTTTTTTPSQSGSTLIPGGQVNTSTSLSTDKKTFTINFLSSSDFAGITTISYSLTYTSDGGSRGVTGNVTVAAETIATNSNGQQYIRKELTVGSCSGTSCTYDTNPKNFRLSVSTR